MGVGANIESIAVSTCLLAFAGLDVHRRPRANEYCCEDDRRWATVYQAQYYNVDHCYSDLLSFLYAQTKSAVSTTVANRLSGLRTANTIYRPPTTRVEDGSFLSLLHDFSGQDWRRVALRLALFHRPWRHSASLIQGSRSRMAGGSKKDPSPVLHVPLGMVSIIVSQQ